MVSLILLDVNVLVSAHRASHVHHIASTAFLKKAHEGREVIGLCDIAINGLLRLATHPKIFDSPSTLDQAFSFLEDIFAWPNVIRIAPGQDHWTIYEDLCRKSGAVGAMVTDAYLAALALEHGCVMATFDKDFDRFPGLRTVRPS